ncbi:dynamin family protein [Meiothermus granaticius]|uniref:Selenocysteine-specific elongation factor n=1 Tax=Meiothermus granaticius NBRC 107808 TaxID=1227551 RepID=A0A399F6I4_9DEIN|nr:dynamin family protein [Meiothermus granaticius]RIH91838.1 Selenocysteine-specific elongation factor [Meiothermus granaticius NBRC 107808]GEM85649.1 GTP-binding protein [Meiothermus granaticius NBRC 107808]
MLDSKILKLAQEVRSLTTRGLEVLARTQSEVGPLRQALLDLDGPFLVVVAGEFNSGKSSLLNALLGADFLKEGVTPTTDRINLIGYGPEPRLEGVSPELVQIYLPDPLLKDLRLVDTPGTNAILQHHQALTERFLPRADLILFVTSADRPFTQSEAQFLDFIRAWGKKVVLVVNKADLLTPPEVQQVLEYVRKGAEQTLGQVPPTFALSARKARQGDLVGSRVPELEAHIRTVLSEQAARFKLGSPLGVLLRLATEAQPQLEERRRKVEEQLGTCRELDALAERHLSRTRADFRDQVALATGQLEAVRARGEAWLEENFRLSNFLKLLNSARLRQSFSDQVVRGANAEIERNVLGAMNWLAKRDRELLEDALHLLREAPSLRAAVREGSEGQAIEGNLEAALREFNPDEEAQKLKDYVQTALQHTALAEVGAVGLGTGLVLIFNKILLDLLGIFAGLVAAILGLTIMARRRETAKTRLRERLGELREKLQAALEESLNRELSQIRDRFGSLYRAPCLRMEDALKAAGEQLGEVQTLAQEARELQARLEGR